MRFIKFMYSPTGKIIISIVLALGLASLFRRVCKGRNCIIYRVPSNFKNKIFKFDNNCYKYKTEAVSCNK